MERGADALHSTRRIPETRRAIKRIVWWYLEPLLCDYVLLAEIGSVSLATWAPPLSGA